MRISVFKRLIAGIANVEDEVSAERGQFSLFALLEKEDWNEHDYYPVGSSWHIFVAAPWIWEEEYAAEKFLRERVRPYEEGWNPFESSLRVHVVKPTSPYLQEVWEYCGTEKGMVEIRDVDILDISAKRGYIFASHRPENFDEILRQAEREAELQAQRAKDLKAWREAQPQAQTGL